LAQRHRPREAWLRLRHHQRRVIARSGLVDEKQFKHLVVLRLMAGCMKWGGLHRREGRPHHHSHAA